MLAFSLNCYLLSRPLSHGKLEWYLGCKIEQDLEKGTVTMTQGKYARDVLARFSMAEAKPVSTPSATRSIDIICAGTTARRGDLRIQK